MNQDVHGRRTKWSTKTELKVSEDGSLIKEVFEELEMTPESEGH